MNRYNLGQVESLKPGLNLPQATARRSSKRPVAIDLFCGAGGLSLGLERAGFDVKLAVDFDQNALASHHANNPDAAHFLGDIRKLSTEDIRAAIGDAEVTLVAGGPSCQGFSTHGKRKADDPRNFLFTEFARVVAVTKPKFVLMENVKGLLTYNGGEFRDVIYNAFTKLGYRVESRVVCAADYGVPQLRHRILFLGTRLDVPISFPAATHAAPDELRAGMRPYVTVWDAISDLPLINGDYAKRDWTYAAEASSDFQKYARREVAADAVIEHHISRPLSKQAGSIARHVVEGQGLRSVPTRLLPRRFRKMRKTSNGTFRRDCTTLYFRPSRNKPSYTITCNFRNVASGPFIHPIEARSFSMREAARLMSFSDDYKFMGTSVPRQIGNAVPPLLAEVVGRHVLKLAKGVGIAKERHGAMAAAGR